MAEVILSKRADAVLERLVEFLGMLELDAALATFDLVPGAKE